MRALLLIVLALCAGACSTATDVGALHTSIITPNPAPRDILVVVDGTQNNAVSRTNAARLFEIVDNLGTANKDRVTATFYAEGVGSRYDFLDAATGMGMGEDVRSAYQFLMRTYRDDKDHIYLSGFSRGAYTVRVLNGMIAIAGVPDLSDRKFDGKRAQIAEDLWNAYKIHRLKKESPAKHNGRRLDRMRAVIAAHDENIAARMGPARVKAIAIWDTVEALGWHDKTEKPTEHLTQFFDTVCNVDHAFHALALDDNRAYSFTPIFLSGPLLHQTCDEDEAAKVEEVWFAGAHADVGGSYPDKQKLVIEGYLPGVSMNWMLDRLSQKELGIVETGVSVTEDVDGPIHSAKDYTPVWGGMYRNHRNPRRYMHEADMVAVPLVHVSVFERLLVAKALDEKYPACDEPGNRGNPLICGKNRSMKWGFMAEMLAIPEFPGGAKPSYEPCLRLTENEQGWQLVHGQTCATVVCRDGSRSQGYCGQEEALSRCRGLVWPGTDQGKSIDLRRSCYLPEEEVSPDS